MLGLCQCKNSPPILIEQPQDMIAELDKPMAIHCRTESSSLDDLHIDWYKDGRLVTTDPNARIITEFMALHIINTMPQDAGIYYCIAKNSYGQTQSRKARIQFLKLDKEFLVSPISTSASLGERIRLSCQPPYGSPNPIVYWIKDGKNLSVPLDHYDLILPSIQKSDFGSYRCIASNGLIRQSSIAYLTEFHRPKLTIQPSSSRIDLHRGQSIDLQCHINNDQYDIEWHFNNKIIRNNHIHISSIEFNQSGIYTCIGRFEKYKFSEQILLAVYDNEILNNEEIFFSQTILTVTLGRLALIECQLPFHVENKISWIIVNHSEVNNIKFEYEDKNQYRLKINRIKEYYHNILFKCYYQNKNIRSQGFIKLNVEQIESPPIISYIPNNQTVPIGVEVIFSCQPKDDINIQWWFIPYNRPYKIIKISDNSQKYRIESNHDLIIQHAEKNDAGLYKCVSINNNYDETIWLGHLHVEDARSNAIFHRVERKDLPQAPSQPIAIDITSNSIELVWDMESIDILDYLIEYYDINSDRNNLEWKRILTKTKNSQQIINNLKSDSIYQFMIRARNSFGYGPSSILSDLIETKTNQQLNDDELIYLYDPINIQETSITIKWNILQKNSLINEIFIYIINKKETNERIETITNSITTYTINNLQPNTDYSIYLVPMFDIIGRSSNTISFRTLESIPSSSPTNIIVQLISTTTLSIRWNSPLENETNGQIIAYKVNCLGTNETNSIRLTNISSDAKGLYIKNLIENMEYCISIAARTRIGYGPYSQPICIIMNAKLLQINQNQLKYRLREAISQPWFLPVIILSSIIFICACAYVIWLCFHYITQQHRHRIKFNSSASSSSNQSVELPVHKTLSNGKRYDLIKDTSTPLPSSSTALWMNSIPNGIRLQCCSTASASSNSEHYSMSIHKNPINALLHECRQQQQLNPYATTGIFQQSTSSVSPNYSKTVHSPPASHHLLSDSQQQITSSASPTVQYQPPWLDHHPSSTLQYHSQSRTSFNQYHCIHCTSQSHPQTPSSIRPTIQSPASHHHQNNSLIIKSSILNTNDINKTTMDSLQQITMNSSPLVKHTSDYISQVQPSNLTMINSLGDETMTTSWISSMDDNNHENVSSSSTDKYKHEKSISKQNHSSSEGSIFSDSDIQQQDETNGSTLINFERGPSFLIPNV
ncbi:unnamed protein product [Rotaria sp. Silwood1]|nr:unnamed protein product [Rotaria sp. Silwood1]CAF0971640.1 unnamed protein product [Rotaria sp. Silwood1]CAF3393327.1 unnamed protein product [Rotaria sp. Silwood1]